MMPPIIAVGGPVGAGKSSVAALLAQEIDRHLQPGTVVRLLRSDVLRKQILGVDLLAKLPQKYYESDLIFSNNLQCVARSGTKRAICRRYCCYRRNIHSKMAAS
jgi:cytidylate kinase